MKNSLFVLAILSGSLFLSPKSLAEDSFLKPYQAVYSANYNFILPFKGTVTRELSQIESGKWRLMHRITSPMIKVTEYSLFSWENTNPRPTKYSYKQSALTKKRSSELTFDWENLEVSSQSKADTLTYSIESDTLDKLSYQLQLRKDLISSGTTSSYKIADRRRTKLYQFVILGEEEIDTDLGPLNTLKIRRKREKGSTRETTIWLAIDWDYLITRIRQKEKGKTYEILLKEAKINGKPVTGIFRD